MSSIINSSLLVDQDFCVVSVVHDKNAQKTNYGNGFIVLEKIEDGQPTIKTFELTIDAGVGNIKSQTYTSMDHFKQTMQKKDCYAHSFNMHNPGDVEETLKKPLKLDDHESYGAVEKSRFSFFSSDMDDIQTVTNFEWARRQACNLRSVDIPAGIESFIKKSIHIGDLSPQQCLVM